MTDKNGEILDLIKERNHHYDRRLQLDREIQELVLDKLEATHPLEGEVWHVILSPNDCAVGVVPAIKGLTGWHVSPMSVDSGMVDDTHIGIAFVYPVERVAEAPTTKEGKE